MAGLPGAGKSHLMKRLYGLRGDEKGPVPSGPALVVDSRQARNRWAKPLTLLPPRARVPIVYLTHVWWIVRATRRGDPVVAHTRGTWPFVLRLLARLAHRRGHEVYLVLLDVPPGLARAGQFARGRALTARTFARHRRRWTALVKRTRGGDIAPADGAVILDRAAADRLTAITFTSPST